MNCPVCGNAETETGWRLSDRFFETTVQQFQLYECSSCGLLFQDPESGLDSLSRFYPTGYWWQDHGGLVASLEKRYREWVLQRDQLAFLLGCVGDRSNCRILEIGCGAGTFVKLARAAGFDAYGLEIASEAVEVAQRANPGRIFCGPDAELIEQGEEFDVVLLLHTLEHVPDPFQYLKRIFRLVARGGGLIVQVPNRASFQARLLGPRWYGLDCPRHVNNFTSYALLYLLGRCGYRIRRVRHFSLRDNAPALVSSVFPKLDPMSRRVRFQQQRRPNGLVSAILEGLYFSAVVVAQPLAMLEASLKRGATVTVYAGRGE